MRAGADRFGGASLRCPNRGSGDSEAPKRAKYGGRRIRWNFWNFWMTEGEEFKQTSD